MDKEFIEWVKSNPKYFMATVSVSGIAGALLAWA